MNQIKKIIRNTIEKHINESERYVGHKIPTEDIFYNKPLERNSRDSELINRIDVFIDDDTFQKNPIKWVEINKIVPTQRFLSKKNLETTKGVKIDDVTGVYLVNYDDFYYIIDGHHRIANQIINGANKIKAFVQDI